MPEPDQKVVRRDHIRVLSEPVGRSVRLARAAHVAVVLAILVATPLIDWSSRKHPEAAAAFAELDVDRDDLLDGSGMRDIEDALRDGSMTRRWVTPPTSRFRAAFFSHYHEKVSSGRERWLFARHRLTAAVSDSRLGAVDGRALARLVGCLDRRLARQGHDLVVMLVPRKGLLADEFLREPLAAPGRYALLRHELLRCGVACPDVHGAMAARDVEDMWFAQDSHWSYLGSYVASLEVAREQGWEIPAAQRETVLVEGPPEPPLAGLWEAAGLGEREGDPDRGHRKAPRLYFRRPSGALARFDKDRRGVQCEVWLVGTSFSAFYDTDLHLEHLTGMSVRTMAVAAKGPVVPFIKACRQLARSDFSGRKVVWEVPAHFFIARQPWTMEVSYLARAIDELPPPPSTLVSRLRPRPGKEEVELLPSILDVEKGRLKVAPHAVLSSGDGALYLKFSGRRSGKKRSLDALDPESGRSIQNDWQPGKAVTTMPLIDGDLGTVRRSVGLDGGYRGIQVELFAEGNIAWEDGVPGKALPAVPPVHAMAFSMDTPTKLEKSSVIWFLSRSESATELVSIVGFDAQGREHVVHEPRRPTRLTPLGVFSAREMAGKALESLEIRLLHPVDPSQIRMGVATD